LILDILHCFKTMRPTDIPQPFAMGSVFKKLAAIAAALETVAGSNLSASVVRASSSILRSLLIIASEYVSS